MALSRGRDDTAQPRAHMAEKRVNDVAYTCSGMCSSGSNKPKTGLRTVKNLEIVSDGSLCGGLCILIEQVMGVCLVD